MSKLYKQRLQLFLLLMLGLLTLNLVTAPPTHAATITVNSTADNLTASDGFCTLREAIMNANLAAGGDTTGGDCVPGDPGADTIIFDSSLNGTPIILSIPGTGENTNATGDLDITDNLTIDGNGATNTIVDGGGIDRVFHMPGGPTVAFNNLTIRNGNPGGGLAAGGGIAMGTAANTVTLNNSVVSGNTAPNGGGIFKSAGTLNANNSTITGNVATSGGGGGGLSNGGGAVTLTNSTISANLASTGGGIRQNNGTLNITGSTLSGNFASGLSGGGGLVAFGGTTSLTNSTVSGNQTNGDGGGIANYLAGSTINLSYVTITNNVADADNAGGGNGGGIRHSNSNTSFTSTIIAGNDDISTPSLDDCSFTASPVTTNGYNLRPTTTGCSASLNDATDITVTTLGLGPLQNNGGYTQTHLPQDGSDAIDRVPSGTNGCGSTVASDQRGATRPTDGNADGTAACDVGAVELGGLQCGILGNSEPATYTFLGNVELEVDDDGSDLDCIRVTDIPISHPNATPGIQTGIYWQIDGLQSDRTSPATPDYVVNLTLPYAAADAGDKVCRYTGSGWNCAADSFVPNVSVTREGISQLSDWAVGDDVGPTAVTLQTFSATNTSVPWLIIGIILLAIVSAVVILRSRFLYTK
jgi:CSLREA domain-containing protein